MVAREMDSGTSCKEDIQWMCSNESGLRMRGQELLCKLRSIAVEHDA